MKLENNAKKYKRQIEKGSSLGLIAAAEIVLSQSKSLTVVDTGKLRDEQHYSISDNVATVGSPTEYAADVEFNKPYLRPAFREKKSQIEKLLGQKLREQMK